MSTLLSFCSDCDFMTRRGFEEIHAFLRSIDLPSGDSFWLFDPSGGDMGLFTHDVTHPGPQHAWLLDQISAGVIDVIHSAGSYGERFNRGYRPVRGQIEMALEYLDKHAVVPRIWTNHGDAFNTQNIGGSFPAPHHHGDLPESEAYCLDLLRDFGVEYFWLDRLIWRNSNLPYRVIASERCRDGNEISTFARYLSPGVEWSPNGQNFAQQLPLTEIQDFALNKQDSVIYTHWGCHHQGRTAITPMGDSLTLESRDALSRLAQQLATLDVQVVRLETILDANRNRPIQQEIQRIGEIVVRPEKNKPDCFYYNQYAKHGLEYFRRRLTGMGVAGGRALDAGCGVGQWSYALSELYDEVHGIEMNTDALKYLGQMTEGLKLPNGPRFTSGSIESLPYGNEYFDFLLCYGVLFCTNFRRTMQEFSRVLTRGGRAYICINGDGWYEYLIDDRFRDRADDFLLPLAEPIWNALVARSGGERNFIDLISRDGSPPIDLGFWNDPGHVRSLLGDAMMVVSDRWGKLVREYSDRTVQLLGQLTYRQINQEPRARKINQEPRATKTSFLTNLIRRVRSRGPVVAHQSGSSATYLPFDGIGSRNRAVLPDEFADFANVVGMRLVESSGDGGLCKDPRVLPIYAQTFNGHDSVWECFLRKD